MALRERFATAVRSADHIDVLRIELRTSDGGVGIGMATATPAITGDTILSMRVFVDEVVRPALLAQPIDESLFTTVATFVDVSPSGTAGVDMALHQLTTMPEPHCDVATSITVSADSAEAMTAAALDRIDAGFSVLKLKLGVDPAGDLQRLSRVVRAVEGRAQVWVDANQGWSFDETMAIIDAAVAIGVAPQMLEQPVSALAFTELSAIAGRVPMPVTADESARSVDDIRRIVDVGSIAAINIKLMKFGGPTGARSAVDAAREGGLDVLVGSMMEHPESVAAAVRFAATLARDHPSNAVHDLDAAWWMADPAPCVYQGGRVVVRQP